MPALWQLASQEWWAGGRLVLELFYEAVHIFKIESPGNACIAPRALMGPDHAARKLAIFFQRLARQEVHQKPHLRATQVDTHIRAGPRVLVIRCPVQRQALAIGITKCPRIFIANA